jgi:hypothetical protein
VETWTKDIPKWAPYAKQTTLQDDGKIDTNLLTSEEAARRYYSTKEFVFSGKCSLLKTAYLIRNSLMKGELAQWVILVDVPLCEQIEIFEGLSIATRFDK